MTKWTRKRLMSALGWLTPASAKSSLAIQKEPAKIHITVSGTSDGGAEGQLEGRKRKEGRGPFVTDWARRFRPSARRAHFARRGRSKGRRDAVLEPPSII